MSSKTCPNGHQMDPSWKVCPYCRSDAAGDRDKAQDKTVREAWPPAPPPPPPPRPAAPVLDATRREPAPPPIGLAETVRERPPAAPPVAERRTVRMSLVGILARGWLVPLAGPQKGESFTFDESGGTAGAGDGNRARLDNEFASARHFEIRFADGRFQLRDSGSTNGTLRGGEPIREATLADGDRITIGRTDYAWKELIVDSSGPNTAEKTR